MSRYISGVITVNIKCPAQTRLAEYLPSMTVYLRAWPIVRDGVKRSTIITGDPIDRSNLSESQDILIEAMTDVLQPGPTRSMNSLHEKAML